MAFPDVEVALMELLEPIAPTYNQPPSFLADADEPPAQGEDEGIAPPFISVIRIPGGGTNRQGWEDTAIVEVAVFGVRRAESQQMLNTVRTALAGRRLIETSVGLLDRIDENNGPGQIPYEQRDIRRIPSTWTVVSRAQ
jgi:hypothetical protein